jgi:CheY-like chemotaxis protein
MSKATAEEPLVKVLIVDDDRVARTTLRAFLKQHAAYWVIEAGDGGEALAAVQADAPSLIFLDLGLPTVSGIEVLETLRRDPVYFDTPVIVLSGRGDGATVQRAIKLGIEDYLTKPLRPLAMERRIVRVLEAVQARPPKPAAAPEVTGRAVGGSPPLTATSTSTAAGDDTAGSRRSGPEEQL